jgi:muramidase (phage lysozyme)
MATVNSYTININKISADTGAIRSSILNSQKSIQNINNAFLKKTKIRSEIFQRRQELNRRRLENESRREQEDVLEYSKMSSISKTPGLALARTGKSFLGRIMDFISNLAIGWLLYNLPTWIGMAKEFVGRVIKLGNIIGTIVSNASGIVISLGQGLVNIVGDIAKLNFAALPNDVFSAFNQVQTNIDNMGKQFEEGFQLFSTGLDKSLTGTDIPQVGQPLPEQPYSPGLTSSGSSSGGGVSQNVTNSVSDPKVRAFLDVLAKPESGGAYNKVVGGGTFSDYSKHPERYNAALNSDAAGRYQFLSTTYNPIAKRLGLKDFSPQSQDLAAVEYLKELGVLDEIQSGDRKKVQSAINRLKGNTWTGLQTYKNNQALDYYNSRLSYYGTGGTSPTNQPTTQSATIQNKGNLLSEYITGDHTDKKHYAADHDSTYINGRFKDNYHDHLAFKDKETTLKAYNFFKSKGFTVTEFGVSSGHSDGSLHYSGRAFDIPGAQWMGKRGSPSSSTEWQGSAKVRAALSQFLGTPESQFSSPSSGTGAMTAAGLTPTSVGEDISVVIPEMGLSSSGGGGGGGQESYGGGMGGQALAESPATVLNNFVKNHLLVELAYL